MKPMDVDDYDWAWQELKLRNELSSADGDAFESLFQKIAKSYWKSFFIPTIPMGSRGDLKCDGFHSVTGNVFQCYGPRYGQADVDYMLKKIDEDFRGAKAHWGDRMKGWIFVVGLYRDKVPSEIIRSIVDLSTELSVPFGIWTRQEIIEIARHLDATDRAELFGRAPMPEDMIRRVTYANIGRALTFIRADAGRAPAEIIGLPASVEQKITFNLLPPAVRQFLMVGQTASERVRQYLLHHAEPHEADRMAEGFRQRYKALISEGADPGEAFQKLCVFAGGASMDPEREAAALAIVTHFFSLCEIFETPPAELAA